MADDHIALIVVSVVGLLAVSGLLFATTASQSTGAYAQTHIYTSCRYLDEDAWGTCMRVERQEGPECDPPTDVTVYYQGGQQIIYSQFSTTGWFTRICGQPRYA